jgi:hypothetical protein
MSLHLESTPHAENINSPDDVYIYFPSGFVTWNPKHNLQLNVWFNGDMFTFDNAKTAQENTLNFNEWVNNQVREKEENSGKS